MSQYFAFQWHITDECDQRCKHCYIFSGTGCKELKSMTWEQMQEVVANCEDFCKVYHRVPYFYITGGDPILHPDFWKLMVLLKSKNIPFTIMGNPFHLNDAVMKITNFEALIDERTMKKKTMIVLMSAFLLLSAFSCGGGNKANSTSEQDEKKGVNVLKFDAYHEYGFKDKYA